ncbi:MAG: alpha/beta fold hydrolase, partial [Stenotrophobium sp.]
MPFVETEAVRFYYEETGEGTPLVFLHGLGASIQDWECQLPVFSRSFRCITVDLRGYGRSGRGTGPLSVERFAADVWSVLGKLDAARYCLVGHSMGGAVALQLALDHPQALIKLVIANSVPTFKPENLRQHFEIWYRLIVMSLMGPVRLARIGAQRMFPDQDQVELREKNAARGARNSGKVYIESLRALTRWSVLDRLGELK